MSALQIAVDTKRKARKVSPLGKLIVESSSFKDENSRHKRVIMDHSLNYSVSLTLPVSTLPCSVTNPVQEGKSYIVHLPLVELISIDFIEAFIKAGKLSLFSHSTRIDTDNCIAILPTGQLVLNLTKDAYQILGLEGKPSLFTKKNHNKFIVHLNLTHKNFIPGNAKYDRIKRIFAQRTDLMFDCLVAWVPQDENVCPSSIQKYFQIKGHTARLLKVEEIRRFYSELRSPVISPSQTREPTDDACSMYEVFDWLGALALCIDLSDGRPDDYLTGMGIPSPTIPLDNCTYYQCMGFHTADTVLTVFTALRELVEVGNCPWGCLTVHGFADSPVSTNTQEHGYCFAGDNFYTFVLFPDQSYWLYTALSTHDVCS
ncbi:hypothetical protein ScPMuIL_001592 [Solemya velum]